MYTTCFWTYVLYILGHLSGTEDFNPVTVWVLDECQSFHFTWNILKRISLSNIVELNSER